MSTDAPKDPDGGRGRPVDGATVSLTRRAMLKAALTASALPLAAGAAPSSAAHPDEDLPPVGARRTDPVPDWPVPRLRRAVKYGMIGEGSTPHEKLALLADLGFEGVEPDSPSGLDFDALRAASQDTGVRVHGVVCSEHWRSPLSHADAAVRERCAQAILRAIEDAQRVGADSVLVVPAVVNAQIAYDDAWTRSTAMLRPLAARAERAGVRLLFENVWNSFLLSPLEAARYVDQFESDAVGWYFDVGNVVTYGWPAQWIRILGHRIAKIDVKEFSREKRDREGLWKGFDVELLEGDSDWPAVMTALRAIGFAGWMTAEIAGGGRDRLADIAARMDRIRSLPVADQGNGMTGPPR